MSIKLTFRVVDLDVFLCRSSGKGTEDGVEGQLRSRSQGPGERLDPVTLGFAILM